MSQFDFNADDVAPSSGFSPIPAGKYVAVISNSEMRDTKSGTGKYLQLEFEIIEGEYNGRRLWSRLNLVNTSQQAVEIARAELSAICHAVGVLKLRDTVELHNLPLVIDVRLKKARDSEDLENVIKGYFKKEGNTPVAAPQTASAPWAKR